MKISYTWLKDFIKIEDSAEEIGKILTDLGLEVEGIDDFESIKGGLEGLVVGHVLSCEPHPNADRLKVTSVDVGKGTPLKIVCGAPNVAVGQKVPVATVNTTLYDQKGEAFKIKKSKIRGEESFGMICAEDELGLGDNHEGIMILEEDLKPGTPLTEVFEILKDKVYEIGLTPNRCDAMSHFGVARDLRAGLLQQEKTTSIQTPSISSFKVDNHTRNIPVVVEDSSKAPRYSGVTLTKVTVKESPTWLKNRLKAIGLNPVNNIVDATNYVMMELGQPFHAFDAETIRGQKITVKNVPEGTKFTTLDGVEHSLSAEDLMICDQERPLCIAGVYGGTISGITENTTNIFLESAYFNPVSIRKTAKRHALNTDASFRFERGIDPNFTVYALKRLVVLIQEIGGGEVSSDISDFYPKKKEGAQVFLRYKRIKDLIGEEIDENILKSILTSLDIKVNNVTESGMGLTIPAFRADVIREVDVIEEILRVYGYNRIDFGGKLNATVAVQDKYGDLKLRKSIADFLINQGFFEIMNNSLTEEHQVFPNSMGEENNINLLNPLSRELSTLRQTLIPGGLQSIAFNINHKNEDLRLFEFGKSYHRVDDNFQETKHLSFFLTGNQEPENWNSPQRKTDFFYLKGVIEALFLRLGIQFSLEGYTGDLLSEGLKITAKEEELGYFGVLKSEIRKRFDVEREVLFADINWDLVLERLRQKPEMRLQEIPKFPSVRRDYALLLDKAVSFGQIKEIAKKVDHKILKEVGLFDVYEGDKLPEGKKSYAVNFTFLDEKKTLTDKKVDKVMKKLRVRFEEELGAELR